ncbi:MAG: glycosyltransferase [Opitutaceae bacterium]
MPHERPDVVAAHPGVVKDTRCGFVVGFTTRPGWKRLRICVQERDRCRRLATRFVYYTSTSSSIEPAPQLNAAMVVRVRETKRRILRAELAGFFERRQTLGFAPYSERPTISILIVVWNQAELTLACLRSLQGAVAGIDAEILIADNASTDQSPLLWDVISGVRIFRHAHNQGFLLAAGGLAREARGDHLLFLNNDTTLEHDSIGRALASLHRRPGIGAVGARVLLPHGVVQEAGNTIWNDGSCSGYGRGRSPDDPGVLDWKYTDYVSGVFLLTRRADFIRLGGFDERLAPAYCEDVDYCIKLWRDGLAVVCDPAVVVHHYEFGSSATPEAAIALQRRNIGILHQLHGDWLASQPAWDAGGIETRFCRDSAYRGHVLVVDDRVPDFYTGAGAPRAVALFEALLALNWKITFYPTAGCRIPSKWFQDRFGSEIRVIHAADREVFAKWLELYRDTFDTVFISRVHNMEALGGLFTDVSQADRRIRVIYDAEAICALRDIVAARIGGSPLNEDKCLRMVTAELALAADADLICAVSGGEAECFHDHYAGQKPVEVLAHTLGPRPVFKAEFAERSGLLFVGRLSEANSPNVDSILWFMREVYPLLAGEIGGPIRIIGDPSALPADVRRLPNVQLLGPVDDLAPYYEQARVFIAPTRFAAGIPLKVIEAARHNLPVVCTSLLAGQLEWRHEHEVLVADTAEEFARECIRLHGDAALWESLSQGAGRRYDEQFSPAGFTAAVGRIFNPPARVSSAEQPSDADLVAVETR